MDQEQEQSYQQDQNEDEQEAGFDFKVAIEKKFQKSVTNKIYIFQRMKKKKDNSQQFELSSSDCSLNSSLDSFKDVEVYNLADQNKPKQLKQQILQQLPQDQNKINQYQQNDNKTNIPLQIQQQNFNNLKDNHLKIDLTGHQNNIKQFYEKMYGIKYNNKNEENKIKDDLIKKLLNTNFEGDQQREQEFIQIYIQDIANKLQNKQNQQLKQQDPLFQKMHTDMGYQDQHKTNSLKKKVGQNIQKRLNTEPQGEIMYTQKEDDLNQEQSDYQNFQFEDSQDDENDEEVVRLDYDYKQENSQQPVFKKKIKSNQSNNKIQLQNKVKSSTYNYVLKDLQKLLQKVNNNKKNSSIQQNKHQAQNSQVSKTPTKINKNINQSYNNIVGQNTNNQSYQQLYTQQKQKQTKNHSANNITKSPQKIKAKNTSSYYLGHQQIQNQNSQQKQRNLSQYQKKSNNKENNNTSNLNIQKNLIPKPKPLNNAQQLENLLQNRNLQNPKSSKVKRLHSYSINIGQSASKINQSISNISMLKQKDQSPINNNLKKKQNKNSSVKKQKTINIPYDSKKILVTMNPVSIKRPNSSSVYQQQQQLRTQSTNKNTNSSTSQLIPNSNKKRNPSQTKINQTQSSNIQQKPKQITKITNNTNTNINISYNGFNYKDKYNNNQKQFKKQFNQSYQQIKQPKYPTSGQLQQNKKQLQNNYIDQTQNQAPLQNLISNNLIKNQNQSQIRNQIKKFYNNMNNQISINQEGDPTFRVQTEPNQPQNIQQQQNQDYEDSDEFENDRLVNNKIQKLFGSEYQDANYYQ